MSKFTSKQYLEMADQFDRSMSKEIDMCLYAAEMAAKFERTAPVGRYHETATGKDAMIYGSAKLSEGDYLYAAPQPVITEGMKLVPVEHLQAIKALDEYLLDFSKFHGDIPDEIYVPFSRAIEAIGELK